MATISSNGGAERYWRNATTEIRLVLCRNGRFLINRGGRGWRLARETYTVAGITQDAAWRSETGPAASAAVTRTTREARRRTVG